MMKIPRLEFNPAKFYLVGKYMFFIAGIVGLIRVIDLFNELKAYDIVSSIASTIFQFALFLFFSYLQGKENVPELNDGDIFEMNKALDKLEKEKIKCQERMK